MMNLNLVANSNSRTNRERAEFRGKWFILPALMTTIAAHDITRIILLHDKSITLVQANFSETPFPSKC